MNATPYTAQKQIHFKTYHNLWELERGLQRIKSKKELHVQVSVLGKVVTYEEDTSLNDSKESTTIKAYWKSLLGNSVTYGNFYNPEISNVFIVGPLASTFLHKINGKPLAMLSAGPYGILRGLGVSEAHTTMYLKMLNSGIYLLILRGSENDLKRL